MNLYTAEWINNLRKDAGLQRIGLTWYDGDGECIFDLWLPNQDEVATTWALTRFRQLNSTEAVGFDLNAIYTVEPDIDTQVQLETLLELTTPKNVQYQIESVGGIDFRENNTGYADIYLGDIKIGNIVVADNTIQVHTPLLSQYSSFYLRKRIETVFMGVLLE